MFSHLALAAAISLQQTPILFDTDIGDDIDDALALALILRSPELEVRGVTTVFKDPHTRALLTRRFLEAVGKEKIPVASGRGKLEKPIKTGQMVYGFGDVKTPPVDQPAVEFLYEKLKAEPGKITLLAVGPLTNVAELLKKHPDVKKMIPRIVIMGGSVRIGYDGKKTPEIEWNIRQDIAAAKAVFDSGVPLVVAPLDSTGHVGMEAEHRKRVFEKKGAMNEELATLYKLWKAPRPVLYDLLAVALVSTEKHCKMENLCLTVDEKGFTRLAEGRPNARVATEIDRDAFIEYVLKRIE